MRITSLELNAITMDLTSILCRQSDHKKCAKRYDHGEKEAFFELLRDRLDSHTPIETLERLRDRGAEALLEGYTQKFERLLQESKVVDGGGALAKSIEAMAIGQLFGHIKAVLASRSPLAGTGTA